MTWTPATTNPRRHGYYAIRYSWSTLPDVAHFGRDGWRKGGRQLHGVAVWLELPPYESPKDSRL